MPVSPASNDDEEEVFDEEEKARCFADENNDT